MPLRIAALSFLLLLSFNAAAQTGSQVGVPTNARDDARTGAAKELHDLFAREWEFQLQDNPTFASSLGDRRYNDRWGDRSLAAYTRREQRARQALTALNRINRDALSPADKLNYDLFKNEAENDIESFKYRFYLMPVSQSGGIQTTDQLADRLRFETVKDYEDWLARIRTFPALMNQTIALMQEGMRARIVQPKILMQRVPRQIDAQTPGRADDSPFFKPFNNFPDSIPAAERERLTAAAREAITTNILPAYRRFKEFFNGEYLPASFEQVGIWQMPNGDAAYRYLAKQYTTTDMTPDQIHQRGVQEVTRIRAEMERIKTQVGFRGTLQEFFQHLRTDPQFYYKTPDELLTAYRAISKRIDPNLIKLFRTIPRMPYGVEPIPAQIAPDTTTAYYQRPAADGSRSGTYYVNLYKPEVRPKYEMMALSLHESVPGHHFQIALAQELGELPNFRRYGGYTAFVEGWGLYAESLGDEMGLYDDPYSKFGQLTYEMWRAVRLVVDTGIHHLRWERQRAIDYFLQNAAKTELDVINEIDRYIGDPGQALAYKIGELKIKELRARAQTELGARFDVREFHDTLLSSGAVPLDVLERKMNDYIAARKTASAAKAELNP